MTAATSRPPRAQAAVLALSVGTAMIIGSWMAVSGEPALSGQVGWLNVGVAGLVVALAGAGSYLVEYRRELRRRQASLREALAR